MKVIYKSSYNQDRAKDFFKFHLIKRSKMKYVYFTLSFLLLLIGIIVFVNHYISLGVVLISSSVFVVVIRPIQANISIKKTIENISTSKSDYYLIFTMDKISYTLDTLSIDYDWDKLIEVAETINYYYFYIKQNSALIVSKSVLGYKESKVLKELIVRKINDKRYKKYK